MTHAEIIELWKTTPITMFELGRAAGVHHNTIIAVLRVLPDYDEIRLRKRAEAEKLRRPARRQREQRLAIARRTSVQIPDGISEGRRLAMEFIGSL